MIKGKRVKIKSQVKKQNRVFLLIVLLCVIALALFLISFFTDASVLEKREIDVRLTIANQTGMKIGNESLDFGRLAYGSSAQKTLDIHNNYDFPIMVEFEAKGDIKNFLIYGRTIYFEPNERKKVGISTIVFSDQPFGNYTGKMAVMFKKLES
jgi:hypothetical protein